MSQADPHETLAPNFQSSESPTPSWTLLVQRAAGVPHAVSKLLLVQSAYVSPIAGKIRI